MGKNTKVERGSGGKKVSQLLASSSSSHLVHEIIFAVLVCKLASTIHISTQVCDQNGGSARGALRQVRQRGRQGGESCERRDDSLCMECKSLASSDILSRNASMADMAMQCAGRCESEGVAGVVLFSAGAN